MLDFIGKMSEIAWAHCKTKELIMMYHDDSAKPTYWKQAYEPKTGKIVLEQVDMNDAHFISSRMSNHKHRLVLDIDHDLCYTQNIALHMTCKNILTPTPSALQTLNDVLVRTCLGVLHHGLAIFTFPTEIYPSTTPGHLHLVSHVPDRRLMTWETFKEVLTAFQGVGLIEQEWVDLCIRERTAVLVKPGVTKEVACELSRRRDVTYSGCSRSVKPY